MTDQQKQCLLMYLGYDCGGIDGILGKKSAAAVMAFQSDYGLEADGIFGPLTQEKILAVICDGEDWWADIRYFRREEFACKCGCYCDGFPAEPEETLVRLAEDVRAHFDAPVTVSSGVRCARHNTNVGGVENSRHLRGKAVDFCVAGKTAAQALCYVNPMAGIRYAYAINDTFVHMDVE